MTHLREKRRARIYAGKPTFPRADLNDQARLPENEKPAGDTVLLAKPIPGLKMRKISKADHQKNCQAA